MGGGSWSEKIAEEPLQVDELIYGVVDEKTVPDSEAKLENLA